MVGRIVRSADFQRVLAVAPRSRSAHFAAHHLSASPSQPCKASKKPVLGELSTGDAPSCAPPVDESPEVAVDTVPAGRWLGLVVPKRHARRSVTRSLLKRQMRAVMRRHAQGLPPGLWVLRLKAPFDRQQFSSAASPPLQQAAGDELQLLLQRAAESRPVPRR
jgi:ribonuclease P protein component